MCLSFDWRDSHHISHSSLGLLRRIFLLLSKISLQVGIKSQILWDWHQVLNLCGCLWDHMLSIIRCNLTHILGNIFANIITRICHLLLSHFRGWHLEDILLRIFLFGRFNSVIFGNIFANIFGRIFLLYDIDILFIRLVLVREYDISRCERIIMFGWLSFSKLL